MLTPDLIVQFGATPVSMRQVTWAPDPERIVVDGRPRRIDPASRGGTRVHADPLALMKLLSARVKPADSRVDPSWKNVGWPFEKRSLPGWPLISVTPFQSNTSPGCFLKTPLGRYP